MRYNILDKKIKVISFDVFDTLITRLLPVNLLYKSIENKLLQKGFFFAKNFANLRLQSEKELLKNSNGIYTIEDIYNTSVFSLLNKEQKEILINSENNAEINNCVSNPKAKEIYNQLKSRYKIVCTSDMYLSSQVIRQILNKNLYYPDDIFVSCECGKSKRNFDLYRHVLDKLSLKKSELLHIGDAVRSDFFNPKLLGINSFHYNNSNLTKSEYCEIFGREILSPVVFEFCHWLHNRYSKENLIFLSREGCVLCEYYNLLFSTKYEPIFVSRKSVIKGIAYKYLQNDRLSDLYNISSHEYHETVFDFSQRIGIDYNNHKKLFERNGFFENSLVNNELFKFIEGNKTKFISDLYKNQNLLKGYLINFFCNSRVNVLVDIGWSGSIQNIISEFYEEDKNLKIYGAYLGINNTLNKSGFLFNSKDNTCNNVLCFSGLLEILFMPKIGSVLGYKDDKNSSKIFPVFDKFEFSDESFNIVKDIQLSVKKSLAQLSDLSAESIFNKNEIVKRLVDFGCKPQQSSLNLFKDLKLYDNGHEYNLLCHYSFKDYIKLSKFYSDFRNSKWKSGFLRHIFKVNLPYYKLLNFFR